MLWDSGTWAPIKGKSARDIDDGHLHFILDGQRMKGEWMLIRLKPRGKEKGENWLLCKVGDDFVGGSDEFVERYHRADKGRYFARVETCPQAVCCEGRNSAFPSAAACDAG
jgi:hypothetical protein